MDCQQPHWTKFCQVEYSKTSDGVSKLSFISFFHKHAGISISPGDAKKMVEAVLCLAEMPAHTIGVSCVWKKVPNTLCQFLKVLDVIR